MNHFGKHITTTQNASYQIQALGAQKELYSLAKIFFCIRCLLVTLVPVVISYISVQLSNRENVEFIFALYMVSALIADHFLRQWISDLKKRAASIQELFDCTVLQIDWNNVLLPERPQHEEIHKYYSQHIEKDSEQKLEKLKDWYSPEIEAVQTNVSSLICQRTNCTYDFFLRKRYNFALGVLLFVNFILLIWISSAVEMNLRAFIANIVFPSVPLWILVIKQITANNDSTENLRSLKTLIESAISTVDINEEVDSRLLRQIQDRIFTSRLLSPLLPDWAFHKWRPKLESHMHFGVRETIQEITHRSPSVPNA